MSASIDDLTHDWGTTFKRSFTLEDTTVDLGVFSRTVFAIRKSPVDSETPLDNSDAVILVSTDDSAITKSGSTFTVQVDAEDLRTLDRRRTYYHSLQSYTASGEIARHSTGRFLSVPGAAV